MKRISIFVIIALLVFSKQSYGMEDERGLYDVAKDRAQEYWHNAKNYIPGIPGITALGALLVGGFGPNLILPSSGFKSINPGLYIASLAMFTLIAHAIASLGVAYQEWGTNFMNQLKAQFKIIGPMAFVVALPILMSVLPSQNNYYKSALQKLTLDLLPLIPGLSAVGHHYFSMNNAVDTAEQS